MDSIDWTGAQLRSREGDPAGQGALVLRLRNRPANDHVVQDRHPEQLPAAEALGDRPVLGTGLWVPAGVVVDQDQGRRGCRSAGRNTSGGWTRLA